MGVLLYHYSGIYTRNAAFAHNTPRVYITGLRAPDAKTNVISRYDDREQKWLSFPLIMYSGAVMRERRSNYGLNYREIRNNSGSFRM
jgi:hypothetical protein